ncbi:MAG: quinolinate synthase NadA [Anaerolineae bacterium]
MNLPTHIAAMSDAEVYSNIERIKRQLGPDVTILAHYYQRDEVVRFADFQGDSLELSRQAARATAARYIVFCGVTFMSETAAILCQPGTIVLQPAALALCPMAEMADTESVSNAWDSLSTLWPDDIVPITYQNSSADVKAFVGKNDGAVCTSSNAARIFRWAFSRHNHILFIPDEHLGTNTALAYGIKPEEISVWDPLEPPSLETLRNCRVVVWKGYCHVHTHFSVQDVARAKAQHPDALIVVHPECRHEVVALADSVGSTSGIIQAVAQAPAGTIIYVGTEWHLVNRLHNQYPDKLVLPLRRSVCTTMAMTNARNLLVCLESIAAGQPQGVIQVDEVTATWARIALERMLEAN